MTAHAGLRAMNVKPSKYTEAHLRELMVEHSRFCRISGAAYFPNENARMILLHRGWLEAGPVPPGPAQRRHFRITDQGHKFIRGEP